MRRFWLATLVGCLVATGANAQQPEAWASIKRQCAEAAEAQMHAQTNCASCVGAWPSAALCAITAYTRGTIPEARTRACIDRIWAVRFQARVCASCGDPLDDVFRCANG